MEQNNCDYHNHNLLSFSNAEKLGEVQYLTGRSDGQAAHETEKGLLVEGEQRVRASQSSRLWRL